MARQLGPLLGSFASYAFGFGLFLTGLVSAITAPIAASFALTQILGGKWADGGLRGKRFRLIWVAVLVSGLLPLVLGLKPVTAIVSAQALNGVILPIVSVLLLLVLNDARMGALRNGWTQNLWGGLAVLATLVLGVQFVVSAL